MGNATVTIFLDYGSVPQVAPRSYGENKYYKIVSYNVELQGGAIVSLLTDGRVSASPGTYYLSAADNVAECDGSGNLILGGDTFDGTIKIKVQKNVLPITVAGTSLQKTYGDTVTGVSWDFKEETDRDGTIQITFASDGFAASAHVGEYPVTAASVTQGGEDKTALYEIKLYPEEGPEGVTFTVNPKEVEFTLATASTVPFNSYRLADGESVVTTTASGVNGEELTAYYRLKEAVENVLTIGERYKVEAFRYEVASSQSTASYSLSDASDYDPAFLYTADEVIAGNGNIVLFQDASLIAERQGDYSYFYYPITYEYLDPVVANYLDDIWVVADYYGKELTLHCVSATAPQGVLPCGSYPVTLSYASCQGINDVDFEGDITVTVTKRTLAYAGEDSAEIALQDFFVKRVSLPFNNANYAFDLTADLTGCAVGDEIPYTSFVSLTDQNFEVSFAGAKVVITKRSTGVSIVPLVGATVPYGDRYDFAALYLDHGLPTERLLDEEVICEYSASGSTARREGLPTEIGAYTVYCSVVSDLYAVAECAVSLRIVARPVAAYYQITSATKVYGQSFDFKNNVQLIALYDYDEATHTVDRSGGIPLTDGLVGGAILTSSGADASMTVGEYDFDYSGAVTSQKIRIAAAYVVDISTNEIAEKFTVVKANAPAAPAFTTQVNGRELKVISSGNIRGELSLKSDYSNAKKQNSATGTVTFTQLTYGAVYYLRVCVEDETNYKSSSPWSSEVKAIPFAKPDVAVSELHSEKVIVTASMKNAASGYIIQHRVGASGAWKDGMEVTGLKPDTQYTLCFRAKNDATAGEEFSFAVKTLRAPVDKDQLAVEFDRDLGTLSVTSAVERLEYRLLSSTGEPLSEEWSDTCEFADLEKDTTYLLQVRLAGEDGNMASEIMELTIDTHKAKVPFSFKKFLSDWFLLIIGIVLLSAAVSLLVAFIKSKKRTDAAELGGK